MRVGLGVSTGTDVVCAALVTVDDDGKHTAEYRTVSADHRANTDTGDLVTSAIELMASLVPGHALPDAVAVTYRTDDDAARIRAALSHTTRDIRLVPESTAAMERLASTGLVDRYETVALVDLGASGMSVTVADRVSGTVLAAGRSEHLGGDVLDRLVKNLVQDMTSDDLRDDIRDDRGIGSARYRSVKERLSIADEVAIERYSGRPLTITRGAFEAAVSPAFDTAVQYVREVFDESRLEPEAIVLIGGGANIPLLATRLTGRFGARVIRVPEPDAVLAVGAATVAASATGSDFQMVPADRTSASKKLSRYSGALAAAVVAGGLVLAYGVQSMTPNDNSSVSPAGSATAPSDPSAGASEVPASASGSTGSTLTPAVIGTPRAGGGTASSTSVSIGRGSTTSTTAVDAPTTTTPPLRPAPNLPSIAWPVLPAPTEPAETTSRESEPSPQPTEVEPSIEPSPTPPSTEPQTSTGPTPNPSLAVPTESNSDPTASIAAPTVSISSTGNAANGSPTSAPALSPPPTVWSPPTSQSPPTAQSPLVAQLPPVTQSPAPTGIRVESTTAPTAEQAPAATP